MQDSCSCRDSHAGPAAGRAGESQEGLECWGAESPLPCCLLPGNLCTTSAELAGAASCQSKAKDSRAEPATVPPSVPWNCLGARQYLSSSLVDLFQGEGHCQERWRLFAFSWGFGKQKPPAAPASSCKVTGTLSQQGLPSPSGCQTLSVGTSSQEPALGGKGEKTSRLVASGAGGWQRGVPACRGNGDMASAGTRMGMGGSCQLTWPLTLGEDFVPAERCGGYHGVCSTSDNLLLLPPAMGEHCPSQGCIPVSCSILLPTAPRGTTVRKMEPAGNHARHSLRQDGENSERNKWGQHADRSGVGMTLLRGAGDLLERGGKVGKVRRNGETHPDKIRPANSINSNKQRQVGCKH